MNLHLLTRRLLGRATCVAGPGARIAPGARIINIGGRSELIRIGASSIVEGELLVFAHGGRIAVGDWCFIGPGTRIWSGSAIEIGHRVLVSHGVNIFDNLTHPVSPRDRHAHFRHIATQGHPRDIDLGDRPVRIEDDAWIAAGATVLRGVRIGRGAIVGAAAVVTRDVPDYAVVAGNPARVVRMLEPHERQSVPGSEDAPGVPLPASHSS
jgi:acetyltransferase-like isoleucine patch superfamily enzyme